MKYYIFFGPPGAGKGTHAKAVTAAYNYKHISTGALLRAEIAAGTELGKEADALISKGNLVPDSMVEAMIANVFENEKEAEGFILDGFPRTLAQAEDLDKILADRGEEVSAVVSIMISDQLVMERILHRASIEGRADDASPEIVSNRIATYHAQTEPLIAYYKAQGKYHEVDGASPVLEENRDRVLAKMAELK